MQHPRIRFKFFPHKTFAAALADYSDCFALPSTLAEFPPIRPHRANPLPIISLFCSPNEYRRKNILNSLLAISNLDTPYLLYLNGLSENPDYRRLLERFRIRYRDWSWMEPKQYRRVLNRVDIGLQVSFSEAFDFVAAEHIQRGIPVVGSRMVPALDLMPPRVKEWCVVENPDDPLEIAAKLEYLLVHPAARNVLSKTARRHLLQANEKNIRQAKTLLLEIISRCAAL
jgi:glycosyltransferase involved in cell wall biosynthesis